MRRRRYRKIKGKSGDRNWEREREIVHGRERERERICMKALRRVKDEKADVESMINIL